MGKKVELTKAQLQAEATAKGVSFKSRTTKEELAKAIKAADRKAKKAAKGPSKGGEY